MDWISALRVDDLASLARGHVGTIAYAMATSLVVAVSAPINTLVARFVGRWNFFLRTTVYVALFTVGYTLVAYWSERILRAFLTDQKPLPLLVITLLAFVGFGVWASSQRNLRS